MRAKLVQALRQYWPDNDDATDNPQWLGDPGTPQTQDPQRLNRLLLRAIREQQQDINDLTARVAALEAK